MSEIRIHPTAAVDPGAKLAAGVTVGPYAIIEGDVELGENCFIDAHAIIRRNVRLGRNNRIHPHAVIGGLPQDLGFDRTTETGVVLGDNNEIRENVTISRATREGSATRLGSDCYLMNNAHVGHDCVVGDRVIFASGSTLGGHVQVGDRVFFGGGSMVHQLCRVGSLAMIAGLAPVTKDVLPYTMLAGSPVKHYRLNLVGLRRAGVDGERLRLVSAAFRRLKGRDPIDDMEATPEIVHLREWLSAPSKRGVYGFANLKEKD